MKYVRKDKFAKPNTPVDILRLALEKERSSYGFYNKLIEDAENIALLSILKKLRDSEKVHIQIIERMLNR